MARDAIRESKTIEGARNRMSIRTVTCDTAFFRASFLTDCHAWKAAVRLSKTSQRSCLTLRLKSALFLFPLDFRCRRVYKERKCLPEQRHDFWSASGVTFTKAAGFSIYGAPPFIVLAARRLGRFIESPAATGLFSCDRHTVTKLEKSSFTWRILSNTCCSD